MLLSMAASAFSSPLTVSSAAYVSSSSSFLTVNNSSNKTGKNKSPPLPSHRLRRRRRALWLSLSQTGRHIGILFCYCSCASSSSSSSSSSSKEPEYFPLSLPPLKEEVDFSADRQCHPNPNPNPNGEGGVNVRMKGLAEAVFLLFVHVTLPLSFCCPANAVLYSPDTKVPRTGELALRRAIPANASMKAIQDSLEDISYLLRIPQRKPYGTMEADVKKALKTAVEEKELILSSIPEELKEKGSLLYSSLIDGKGGLPNLIQFIKQNDPDKVSVGLALSLDTLAELELLQAPGLSFLLPEQYLNYPRLTGRGTVELTIERGNGATFFPTPGGEQKSLATIQAVLDGYSAPLTAGNFAKLVLDGAYDGVTLKCTDQAVLVDSKPENSGYNVPLEIMPSGQFEPLYKSTLSIQDGELPVLPLSVYGSVAMAHSTNSDEYSSPSQFFFYLYDKRNAGLGGLSFDEGQFSVFGYTTTGREVLSQMKSGDVIRSVKLVEGRDRLVLPVDN